MFNKRVARYLTETNHQEAVVQEQIVSRLTKLERRNRLLVLTLTGALLFVLLSGFSVTDDKQTVRCARLEVVAEDGSLLAIIGTDEDGSRGLFINDKKNRLRVATIHDDSQSAFYAFDTTGTIRVGVAQYAHGGGGFALHGAESKGGTVLYHKNEGSLSFFDAEGKTTYRVSPKNSK